jgi:hypothetical protein
MPKVWIVRMVKAEDSSNTGWKNICGVGAKNFLITAGRYCAAILFQVSARGMLEAPLNEARWPGLLFFGLPFGGAIWLLKQRRN